MEKSRKIFGKFSTKRRERGLNRHFPVKHLLAFEGFLCLVAVAFENEADGVLHVLEQLFHGFTLADSLRSLDAFPDVPSAFLVFADNHRVFHGSKNLFVRSSVEQIEHTTLADDAVHQQPVELDVAFAIVLVVACKLVVFVLRVEFLAIGQLLHNVVK